jgi:hypothetical protein
MALNDSEVKKQVRSFTLVDNLIVMKEFWIKLEAAKIENVRR